MNKYIYSFKYLKPNDTAFTFGSVHLIADNIVIANRMFERLYCDSERGCSPIETFKPKLDVYSIIEQTDVM